MAQDTKIYIYTAAITKSIITLGSTNYFVCSKERKMFSDKNVCKISYTEKQELLRGNYNKIIKRTALYNCHYPDCTQYLS
jgi:hypothetical protein